MMLRMDRLFADSNTLCVNNPTTFQNTMRVTGSCYVFNSCCNDLGNDQVFVEHKPCYFSGYVFRADRRNPKYIFESGFHMNTPTLQGEELYRTLSGAQEGGITRSNGISTSICVSATNRYACVRLPIFDVRMFMGYVYLIDAVDFKGFAIPSPFPTDPISARFPHLKDVYEVNFPNLIPNFKIVGVVYPPEVGYNLGRLWPDNPSKLSLAVNPYYTASFGYGEPSFEGIEAASMVVDRFNGTDWVLV